MWVLFCACAGLSLFLGRMWSLGDHGEADDTVLWQSWLILEGYLPYRDFFLARPPLLPWSVAALAAWTGSLTSSFFILAWLASMGTLFGVFRLALDWFGRRDLAATAAVFYALWGPLWHQHQWHYTQFLAPCLLWGSWMSYRVLFHSKSSNWGFASGVALGIGLLIKIFALYFAVAMTALLILHRRRRHALLLAAGFALPFLLTASYFRLKGASALYLDGALLVCLRVADVLAPSFRMTIWHALPLAAALPFLPATRGAAAPEGSNPGKNRFLLACLAAGAAMLYPMGVGFYFLPCLPYLSLAAASWMRALAPVRSRLPRRAAPWLCVALVLVPWKVYPWYLYAPPSDNPPPNPLTTFLRRGGGKGGTTLILGAPGAIYRDAGLLPPKTWAGLGDYDALFSREPAEEMLRLIRSEKTEAVFLFLHPDSAPLPGLPGLEIALADAGYRLRSRMGLPRSSGGPQEAVAYARGSPLESRKGLARE